MPPWCEVSNVPYIRKIKPRELRFMNIRLGTMNEQKVHENYFELKYSSAFLGPKIKGTFIQIMGTKKSVTV